MEAARTAFELNRDLLSPGHLDNVPNAPTVMLLSSDVGWRQCLKLDLLHNDFNCVVTSRGLTVFELLTELNIATIVIDMEIEELDPFFIVDELQEAFADNMPTVIMATRWRNPAIENKALIAGATAVVTKSGPMAQTLESIMTHASNAESDRIRKADGKLSRLPTRNDPVTLLVDRRHFERSLRNELGAASYYGQHLSFIAIAPNDWDAVVARAGEEMGTTLVSRIARILKGELRSRDSVGHWDGSTIAILLPDTTQESAQLVAKRLSRVLETTQLGNLDTFVKVGFSTGVSSFVPGTTTETEQLSGTALAALRRTMSN